MTEKQKLSPIVKYGGAFLLLCVLIFILTRIGIIPTAAKPTSAHRTSTDLSQGEPESPEYMLATIEKGNVSRDDILITRFGSLLRELDSTYSESEQEIADITIKAQRLLKDDGINENPLNIMEGMNKLFSSRKEKRSYAAYISTYSVLRKKGKSHDEAIEVLKAVVQKVGFN